MKDVKSDSEVASFRMKKIKKSKNDDFDQCSVTPEFYQFMQKNNKPKIDLFDGAPELIWKKVKRGPYNKIPISMKKKAVQLSKKLKDPAVASKMVGVPLKNLKRWIKNGCNKRKGGRKTLDPQMEEDLTSWLLRFHKLNNYIPQPHLIKKMAKEFSNYPDRFKASKGWYEWFIIRFQDSHKELQFTQRIKEFHHDSMIISVSDSSFEGAN